MRRICSGIAGIAVVLGIAGCGETTDGPVESKQMNNEAIQKLRENMSSNAKSGKYKERPTEKPADAKTAEKK
jgi:hypothetical protein